jgi:hypothetical protein
MTATYMSTAQFISCGDGCGAVGKKQRIKTMTRNKIEKMLIANPYRPRLKRPESSGSPRHRFNATQDMDTMYDEIRAQRPRDVIWLYATVEPMFMRDNKVDMISVRMMALRGMSQPVGTLLNKSVMRRQHEVMKP